MVSPATLSSPAERERYERVVQAAETMLAQDGERGLQMKLLAQSAGVALATLYRYFPSKDHVLGAVTFERHQRALQRLGSARFAGATPGERAGDVLVREFRSVQRHPEMASALDRASSGPDRSTSEYIAGIRHVIQQIVLAALAQDEHAVTDEQRQVLPLFIDASRGATTLWLCGVLSADQATAQIRAAARLFDLPPEIIREYLTAG